MKIQGTIALKRLESQRRRRCPILAIRQQYNRVIEMCTEYLEQKMTVNNCIEMMIFADKHRMYRLSRMAAKFIDVNFETVFISDEFLELTIDQLLDIVPLLVYKEMTEDDIQNAILLWSKYKRVERKKCVNLIR